MGSKNIKGRGQNNIAHYIVDQKKYFINDIIHLSLGANLLILPRPLPLVARKILHTTNYIAS